MDRTGQARDWFIWVTFGLVIVIPIIATLTSPQLAWRGPLYIAAGLAGVVGLALLVVQPALAGGYLPGLSAVHSRTLHRVSGASLGLSVFIHVAGLWITSPPDVIDAMLFRSPTPFAPWGVIAMWAVFATSLVVLLRKRLFSSPRVWRRIHTALALVIVICSVVHAVLILGTMEPFSKYILCGAAILVTFKAIINRRAWALRAGSKTGSG